MQSAAVRSMSSRHRLPNRPMTLLQPIKIQIIPRVSASSRARNKLIPHQDHPMSARRDLASATFSDSVNGVFTLAPQTTPYSHAPPAVATGSSGANNNKCNSHSVFCFTTAGQLSRGYACDLVDGINADNYQYLDGDCYPPHYNLINHGGTHASNLRFSNCGAQSLPFPKNRTQPRPHRRISRHGLSSRLHARLHNNFNTHQPIGQTQSLYGNTHADMVLSPGE